MSSDDMEKRARERRLRLVSNKASNFAEADAWDLAYWQGQSPEQRLAAFVALREDVEKVQAAKAMASGET